MLIETLYVHKLVSWQRYRVAYRLDRTMLTTITLAYVAVLTMLFVLPFNQSVAIAIACVMCLGALPCDGLALHLLVPPEARNP